MASAGLPHAQAYSPSTCRQIGASAGWAGAMGCKRAEIGIGIGTRVAKEDGKGDAPDRKAWAAEAQLTSKAAARMIPFRCMASFKPRGPRGRDVGLTKWQMQLCWKRKKPPYTRIYPKLVLKILMCAYTEHIYAAAIRRYILTRTESRSGRIEQLQRNP